MERNEEKSHPGPPIFGTDGVRDRAGQGWLSAASVERLATAAASVLLKRDEFPDDFSPGRGKSIVIGRDTRASGAELVGQLGAVFTQCGFDVFDVGVLPTPGVALVAREWGDATLGVVISASHNPAEYNGIKFLTPGGSKVSRAFEQAVEQAFHGAATAATVSAATPGKLGQRHEAAFSLYVDSLVRCCSRPERLAGRDVVLDCAHGAAYRAAPAVFERLGMQVVTVGADPDGKNINAGVGALHPEVLGGRVASSNAPLGFCFDGDADRMIPVTGAGTILDGDYVLALVARSWLPAGRLPLRTVVATVMSNVGLEVSLREIDVTLQRTDVGDRYVYEAMVAGGHPLGGEQSGHLLFLDVGTTGDGILAALKLMDSLQTDEMDLEAESRCMHRYPQLLKNVEVANKPPFESLPEVMKQVDAAEAALGSEGRVLLRYSGTEPLARVMLEGPDMSQLDQLTDNICAAIRNAI